MEYSQYKEEASRTMAQLGDLVHDSLHMTVGMNTECTELLKALKSNTLDITNLKEEIGDLMWYVANYARTHSLPLMNQEFDSNFYNKKYHYPKEVLEDIIICVGELQDLDKKLFAYKKPYNQTEQFGLFLHLNNLILALCDKMEFDLSKILQTNIDKLKARYPNKFTEQDAIVRNLDKERKILENEV